MNAPVSSAAAAVMILNVEPGVNRPWVARFRSGAAPLHGALVSPIFVKSFSTRFGLYVGLDAITSVAPVRGLSATAAPHWPASASSATFCAFALIVVYTSLPVTVTPRQRSKVERNTELEVPVRAGEVVVEGALEPGLRALTVE